MDTPIPRYDVRAGDRVIAADGDKVGSLAAFHGSCLVVEKGLFFPKDHSIPTSAVNTCDPYEGKNYLSVTRDTALSSGWDTVPTDAEKATFVDASGGPTSSVPALPLTPGLSHRASSFIVPTAKPRLIGRTCYAGVR